MRKLLGRAAIIVEIPLAVLSLVFFKITKFCFDRLIRLNDMLRKQEACRWRVTAAHELRSPLVLTAFMTSAPRWNTHAIIATAGPFEVQQTIRLHAATAHESARSWTAVAHGFPMKRIGASLGSLEAPAAEPWQTMRVPPGRYRVVLRYYHWSAQVELPALEIDGVEKVAAQVIAVNVNDFYHDLAKQRTNLFYLCLHYYIGPLLRYRRWLPKQFVEREYLPASNPETEFYYGFLEAGEALVFDLHPNLLQRYDIYFTSYNLASFPLLWYPIGDNRHITAPLAVDATYLIRVHQKAPVDARFDPQWVRLSVLPRARTAGRGTREVSEPQPPVLPD